VRTLLSAAFDFASDFAFAFDFDFAFAFDFDFVLGGRSGLPLR
jgi:hypothetical protein